MGGRVWAAMVRTVQRACSAVQAVWRGSGCASRLTSFSACQLPDQPPQDGSETQGHPVQQQAVPPGAARRALGTAHRRRVQPSTMPAKCKLYKSRNALRAVRGPKGPGTQVHPAAPFLAPQEFLPPVTPRASMLETIKIPLWKTWGCFKRTLRQWAKPGPARNEQAPVFSHRLTSSLNNNRGARSR